MFEYESFYVQLLRILQEESLATAPLLLPGLMIQQGHDGYIREQKQPAVTTITGALSEQRGWKGNLWGERPDIVGSY